MAFLTLAKKELGQARERFETNIHLNTKLTQKHKTYTKNYTGTQNLHWNTKITLEHKTYKEKRKCHYQK